MWIFDYTSDEDNPYKDGPFPVVTHFAYVDNSRFWTYPWHDHKENFELGFVISGKGYIYIGEEKFEVHKGSMVIIPPDIYHKYAVDDGEDLVYYTIRFADTSATNELLGFFKDLGTGITDSFTYFDFMQENFRILMETHHSNGGIVDGVYQSVVLVILQWVRVLFKNDYLTVRIKGSSSVGKILEYIQLHRADDITLDFLSHYFSISPSQLNRLFNKAYHTSPINYLLHCRVTYATEYLSKTDYSVEKISELVGYQNPKHFINMFTARIGCTPAEYREKTKDVPYKGLSK